MNGRYMKTVKNVMQWGKIFLPLSSIRYFPPQFVLRNPVLEGVTAAFQAGHEVAVIVFNIINQKDLIEQMGQQHHNKLMKNLKKSFQKYIDQEGNNRDVITLHDHYGDGVTLLIKVNQDRHSISNIDILMKKVTCEVEHGLKRLFPSVQPIFEAGYMFVEKGECSIQESVFRAHRQAMAMAEKRVHSEFNEMVYTIGKIVSEKNITMLAQPIINVATSKVFALEMLTRGPKGTALESPLQLFSVARQTGQLYKLEMIVIEKVFQQIKETRCRQDIFINCTPITLANSSFTRDIKRLLTQYTGIYPKQITFEVTERDSIDGLKDFNFNIKVLRLMGFKFAVDDTGAGYANLNSISEIMPDIIKIDRSVIENIDKNSLKESMLKGLLLVAREAGSLVVAEGIENEGEASVLTRNKVDLAQGYFYARPTDLLTCMAT
jgi:EAL domain-containing protein (putative c-di-GMP-specific phosphodiesterase class I)